MRTLVAVLFLLLFVIHQDLWNWDNRELMFGFLPVGLAYHAGFSIAAALLWLFAVKFAWPSEVEAWAEEGGEGSETLVAGSGEASDADRPHGRAGD